MDNTQFVYLIVGMIILVSAVAQPGLVSIAVNKFDYLTRGIAIVFIFIGVKMPGRYRINQWIDKTKQVFI